MNTDFVLHLCFHVITPRPYHYVTPSFIITACLRRGLRRKISAAAAAATDMRAAA